MPFIHRAPYLLLLSLLAPYAAAQEAPPPEPLVPQVAIKGSTSAYDARRDDTATKIVVNQDELLKYGDSNIADVLKRLPGITVGGVPGRGGEIRMRGLGNGYTQILLNGEPSPPGFSLDTLPPDLIERIEIIRAATAEYSTQAIAGTINIVLKRTIVTAQREVKLGVRSVGGQPGTNPNFQISDRRGIYSYAIAGGMTDNKQQLSDHGITTMHDAAGDQVLRRDLASASHGLYQALNLAPRVNVNLGPQDTVTSQTLLNGARFTRGAHERTDTLAGALPRFSSADSDLADTTMLVRTDVSWLHKMAADAKLDVKAGVNVTRRSNDDASRNVFAVSQLALDRTVHLATRDKGATASAKYTTRIVEGHTLAAGWDGAFNRRSEGRLQREVAPAGADAVNVDQAFAATVGRVALFAQDEWTIDKQWSGYLGVRWEGIRIRSAGIDAMPVANTASVWSPLFQALYKVPGAQNNQIRLALTRTFKALDLVNVIPRRILATNNTATTPDLQGNPAIRPELASGLDLGFEHFLAGGGLLSASGYLRRITDNVRNNIFLVNDAWVSMPVNTGSARAHGIELEAKFALQSWSKAAPAIDVRANFARNWSTLASVPGPNNRLVSQTPFSSTVGLDYQAGRLPLTLGASYSFQNGGPVRFSENEFDYAGPKRVLDLYALVKFAPGYQLRLAMDNALHQDYITATTWIDRTGALSDAAFTPTSTLFRATLELKL